jgi:hypothetical protein
VVGMRVWVWTCWSSSWVGLLWFGALCYMFWAASCSAGYVECVTHIMQALNIAGDVG